MKSYKERVIEKNSKRDDLYIMTDEELARLKAVLLETYLDVAKVCDKHNLVCFLGGGSCLGAVRHKGFIPWDDDLDMIMPRKDYEIFKSVFGQELGEKYILDAPNNGEKSITRFPKILIKGTRFVGVGSDPNDERACIDIDIFPLENVPDNKLLRKLKGWHSTFLMGAGGTTSSYENWKRKDRFDRDGFSFRLFCGMLLSPWGSQHWFDRYDKEVRCKNENSEYLGIPSGRKHYFGEILKREVYLPVSWGEFEGKKVALPGDWDAYLTNLYHDYMWIPPEEKREKHYITGLKFKED